MLLLGSCTDLVADSTPLTVASITLSLGISSFSLAGLYCTHQDLSPKYAPAMLGLTNTVGAVPGILGVMTVGFIYDQVREDGPTVHTIHTISSYTNIHETPPPDERVLKIHHVAPISSQYPY